MGEVFVRPPTTQAAVLSELRTLISTGELRPGEPIVQLTLASRLGVSRVPLREALKVLEGEGQVKYSPHKGYSLIELSYTELVGAYDLRKLLETRAVRRGVEMMTDPALKAIQDAQVQLERAYVDGDRAEMAIHNYDFHFRILENCGDTYLVRLIGMLWNWTNAYRSVYYNSEDNTALVVAEHRAILEALRRGDVELVVEALDDHRAHTVAALGMLLDQSARRPDEGNPPEAVADRLSKNPTETRARR